VHLVAEFRTNWRNCSTRSYHVRTRSTSSLPSATASAASQDTRTRMQWTPLDVTVRSWGTLGGDPEYVQIHNNLPCTNLSTFGRSSVTNEHHRLLNWKARCFSKHTRDVSCNNMLRRRSCKFVKIRMDDPKQKHCGKTNSPWSGLNPQILFSQTHTYLKAADKLTGKREHTEKPTVDHVLPRNTISKKYQITIWHCGTF
jgi:hypothetical protein